MWAGVRAHLLDIGLPTTRRRIHAFRFDRRRDIPLLEVGGEPPDGEPVLIILEASNLPIFYCCTPWHGVAGGEPHPLALNEHGEAIDFDAEVVGRAREQGWAAKRHFWTYSGGWWNAPQRTSSLSLNFDQAGASPDSRGTAVVNFRFA